MIDFELLDRLQNGSPPPQVPVPPTWEYVLFVVGLQFGPPMALLAVLYVLGILFE